MAFVYNYSQVIIINMTLFFDGGPSIVILTLAFWYPNEEVVFGILNAGYFFNMTLFEDGS